jgi:hypothetical protein
LLLGSAPERDVQASKMSTLQSNIGPGKST